MENVKLENIALIEDRFGAKLDYMTLEDGTKLFAILEKLSEDNCEQVFCINDDTLMQTVIGRIINAQDKILNGNDYEELEMLADAEIYNNTKRFNVKQVLTGNKNFNNKTYKEVFYYPNLKENEYLFLFKGADMMSNSASLVKKDDHTYYLNLTPNLIVRGYLA